MKFDVNALRYLTRDDFRVLTAVEMGMKNHDLVPVELITQIAALRLGGVGKIMSTLLRHHLLHHERKHFDGYRLTYLGYDYLALRTFLARETVSGIGRQIGVGKESDIYVVQNEEGEELVLKLHRLGRTSFRAIKNKRDYHSHRGSPSWLYLSRLAATKENTFLKILHEHGFPVPRPVDGNRHGLVMSLVDGFPLTQVRELDDPETVYMGMMDMIERFARHGLIHGDFNEFNVLISKDGQLTVIDFPQMVSTRHPNARMYFERDVNCVRRFFRKRFNFFSERKPDFDECLAEREKDLDVTVAASGWTYKMAKEFDRFIEHKPEAGETDDEDSEDDDEDDDEEEGDQVELEGGKPSGDAADAEAEPLSAGAAKAGVAAAAAATGAQATTEAAARAYQAAMASASGAEGVDCTAAGPGAAADRNEEGADESAKVPAAAESDAASEARSDNGSDAESVGDGPNAYLAHDYASVATRSRAPQLDDIRRRARRDFTRKVRHSQRPTKSSRNTVKSRAKRQVANEVAGKSDW